MNCFIAADEDETLNVINELYTIIQHHTSKNQLIAACLRGWSLLVSTISKNTGVETITEQ